MATARENHGAAASKALRQLQPQRAARFVDAGGLHIAGNRAAGAADRFVKAWTVADAKLVKSFEGHTHQVLGVSFKRDGRTVVSAGADNAVKVWSLETGEGKKTVQGFTKEATSIAFVGVTDQFLTTGGDSKVRIVNEAGSDVKTFSGATDFVYASAVKPL